MLNPLDRSSRSLLLLEEEAQICFGLRGAVAHLGERFNGIEEVGGSSPPSSTIFFVPDLACVRFRSFSPLDPCLEPCLMSRQRGAFRRTCVGTAMPRWWVYCEA